MHTGIRSLFLYIMTVFLVICQCLICQAHGQEMQTVELTPAERGWINANPVILCAPDPDFPPAEFFDKAGKYQGLVADFIDLVFERVGLKKQIVRKQFC